MRTMILLLSILFTSPVFAMKKNVEIDSKLFVNGKRIGSPRIVTLNGEKAKVILHDQKKNKGYNLEFHPFEVSGEKILLKYALAVREQGNEILSRGQLKVAYDKDGMISLDRGKIKIHFKVKKS